MSKPKHNYWIKSGSYAIFQNLLSVSLSVGTFWFLVRSLDKEEWGAWAFFNATTVIFDTARSGLIQNSLIRFLSFSPKEEHQKILSASFSLNAITMAICLIVNFALAGFLANKLHYPDLRNMFYVFSLVYVIQGILSQFHWIEQANLSFRGVFVTNVIKFGGTFLFVAWAFLTHHDPSLFTLILVQGLSAAAATIVEYFYVRPYLNFKYSYQPAWIKKLLGYGKYAFGTSISSMLSPFVDQAMLGSLVNVEASGAFNVATRIINMVDIPTNSIATIVFPQSAKRLATEGHGAVRYLYEKSIGAILAILLPSMVFLLLFPALVVRVLAGSQYADSVAVLQITVFNCLMIPFGRQFGTIIDSIGKPAINLGLVMAATFGNGLLNLYMIPRYHILGAAYAMLMMSFVLFCVQQYIMYRQLGSKPWNAFIYAWRFYPEMWEKYGRKIFIRTKSA